MALNIQSSNPNSLLNKIKKAIDDKVVITWSYDGDGDFTHVTSNEQWKGKAWFRPYTKEGILHMAILGQTNVELSKVIYGVYHGRFSEMILTHFDDSFTNVVATAQKSGSDNFK